MFKKVYPFDQSFWEKYAVDARMAMTHYYLDRYYDTMGTYPLLTEEEMWDAVRLRGEEVYRQRYVEFGQKLLQGKVDGWKREVPFEYPNLSFKHQQAMKAMVQRFLPEMKENHEKRKEAIKDFKAKLEEK